MNGKLNIITRTRKESKTLMSAGTTLLSLCGAIENIFTRGSELKNNGLHEGKPALMEIEIRDHMVIEIGISNFIGTKHRIDPIQVIKGIGTTSNVRATSKGNAAKTTTILTSNQEAKEDDSNPDEDTGKEIKDNETSEIKTFVTPTSSVNRTQVSNIIYKMLMFQAKPKLRPL